MDKYKTKTRLAYKIYSIVLISVALCAVLIGILNYNENKNIITKNLGSGLKKIAQTAVLGIDADNLNYINSIDDPAYINIRKYLLDVKNFNEIEAPLYILKRADRNTASLLITTEPGSLIGTKFKLNPTLRYTLDTCASGFSPIYNDKNGTWISAYAPIKNQENIITGILEINYHVGYYVKQLKFTLIKAIVLCLIGFLIGAFLGIPFLKPILQSISTLTTAAIEMEKGNYDYNIRLKSTDEIGYLAYAFEKMRLAIKDYIEKLKDAWLNEKKAHIDSVKALSEAIAVRESYTKGHIERVSKYAELIGKKLNLGEEEIDTLKYGCILHDVGKIGISLDLINKPSKLTLDEYEKIKMHPHLGAQIIAGVKFLEKARDIILYHQERYDGRGYPKGLKGEDIPISARIVSVVDAYDAMSSDRPYRQKLDKDEIISRIKTESGKQFDPNIVNIFLEILEALPDNNAEPQ